ncbi:double-stranded RNA-specific editase B2-like isoform X2 [Maniola jurtina]|uniref:double-stranded RNA-specific editase B2-like isoform X2 n=1 Tax=Maniola jurtina TaxID=191418 RepID=UPI001E68B92F|nr:double-stranded RNA-specific editase B2-like isoform X2 [Maniola jurtina]
MSYNKYNTRNSGRFNTPGQFVPAGEGGYGGAPAQARTLQPVQYNKSQGNSNQNQNNYSNFQTPAPPPPPVKPLNQQIDVDMKVEPNSDSLEDNRPPWMKAKLQGVKKISNKERRRRQNENLRRLLSPKSALMVLNEIMPGEQVTNQFHVEAVGGAGGNQYFRSNTSQSFCAALTLQGNNYKGYGDNKLTARNAAAEQAVRDLILRKMTKVLLPEANDSITEESTEGGEGEEEETLPMIQLASFALHKLFAEWEYEGHKVPQLRIPNASVSDTGSVAGSEGGSNAAPRPRALKVKVLPENAASMHPCMLLTYMRPQLEYRELGVEGDRPQNMLFTMGVDVDGTTYTGKATNKKEARKQAARAACAAIFGVNFDAPA